MFPRTGVPVNNGRLILEAGDRWGDELSSVGKVMARAEMSRTPPGLMSGPVWRAGPSYVVFEAPGKGPGVPPSSDISEIPEAPQGRQLGPLQAVYMHEGPENGHLQLLKCLAPPSLEC